jgi:hypothetical protein
VFVWGLLALWLSSYLPYLSLGIDTFGSEGERYLYLPSVFLSIIIGIGIINASRGFKYTISLLFFLVNIILLNNFRNDYEVASAVTSATAAQFKKVQSGTIFINQLPQENNGVLIFRTGIEDAHRLFAPKGGSALSVLSVYPGNYLFFTGVYEAERTNDLPGKNGDTIFDFANSSLTISR